MGYVLGLKAMQDAVLLEVLECMEEEEGPLIHPTFKVVVLDVQKEQNTK